MPNYPFYDISAIKEILPHRSPFLFVDRIVKLEAGEKIIAEKDLSINESFFTGHFPGNPIMPGVLISEALAQTSGLLLGLTWKDKGTSLDQEKIHLILATINMKFSHPAKPGDTLRLEASLKKEYGKLFLFEAAAYVVNKQIAKGTLTLAEEK
ncbi:MAG: 3-hydroxyacyl-ACP dehydratase FabZ [Deltaproteobacteria bacterium]|nr:3-hydroxyacyl-ACP dehydratase FabZ [Deltaproteobacteria bacterium]